MKTDGPKEAKNKRKTARKTTKIKGNCYELNRTGRLTQRPDEVKVTASGTGRLQGCAGPEDTGPGERDGCAGPKGTGSSTGGAAEAGKTGSKGAGKTGELL